MEGKCYANHCAPPITILVRETIWIDDTFIIMNISGIGVTYEVLPYHELCKLCLSFEHNLFVFMTWTISGMSETKITSMSSRLDYIKAFMTFEYHFVYFK